MPRNNTLFLTLLITLSLLQCKQEEGFLVAPKSQIINQSFQLGADSLHWTLEDDEVGLLVEGEDIVLDFGGAVVYGKNFGQAPDQQVGTAIQVKKAKKLTIKNATFLGFRNGIKAEDVDTLLIEHCVFDYGFRRLSELGQKPDEAAIILNNKAHLQLENSSVKRWQNGIFATDLKSLAFNNGELALINNIGINIPEFCELTIENIDFYQVNPFGPIKDENIQKEEAFLIQKGISTPALLLEDEYGQYDHSYPKAWLRERDEEKDIFLLTAPQGNWRLVGGSGYNRVVPKTGTFPVTISAFRSDTSQNQSLKFEYLGKSAKRYGKPVKGTIPFSISL
ncbi:MAG: right-handed parallel beta-helix repeat-containing protein [Bacteroidota bacterium]